MIDDEEPIDLEWHLRPFRERRPWLFVALLPFFFVLAVFFLASEFVLWVLTGRQVWREPGGPTIGTFVLGWLGFDVSVLDDERDDDDD